MARPFHFGGHGGVVPDASGPFNPGWNTAQDDGAVLEKQQDGGIAWLEPRENEARPAADLDLDKEASSAVHEGPPDEDDVDAITSLQPGMTTVQFTEKGDDNTSNSVNSSSSEQQINIDKPLGLVNNFEELSKIMVVFADRHHLSCKVDILRRGACVEKDQERALSDPVFPAQERNAVEDEYKIGFWGQSKALKSIVIVVGTLAGMCQGWSQAILNGSAPLIATYLDLHIRTNDPLRNNGDLWVFGVLLAAMPLAAGILSPFIADPLQSHYLGRRGAIATSSAITIAATVGAAASHTTAQLIGCRILWGASLGAKAACVAPYLSEISPKNLRGALTSHWQISDAAGIFLGFVSWLIVDRSDVSTEAKWRILTLTLLIPAVPLLIVAYLVPESQTFLLKKPDYPAAFEAASQLRNNSILASREIVASHFQMEAEGELMRQRKTLKDARRKKNAASVSTPNATSNTANASDAKYLPKSLPPSETKPLTDRLLGPPGVCPSPPESSNGARRDEKCVHSYHMTQTSYFGRLRQLFDDARCRRALLCSSCAMLTQGFLCGINVLAFFSSVAYDNADFSTSFAAGLAVGFGAVNYICGLPAYWLSDRWGRTTLLLLGLPVMALIMFILAFLFLIPESNPARAPVIGIFALIFVAVYSPTAGPSPFALSAEVFPAVTREVGMAVSVSVNMISLGLLILVSPWLSSVMHGYTASLCFFAVLNLVGFSLCFLFCPDTKGRSLDEQSYTFDLPTSLHCKYRLIYVLPGYWNHYIAPVFRRKRQEDAEDTGSFDDQEDWPLLPFHRWARTGMLDGWEEGSEEQDEMKE